MQLEVHDAYWHGASGPVRDALRVERHFGGIEMRCFAHRPTGVDAFFRDTVATRGDHEALVLGSERISYRQLDAMVDAIAGRLQHCGVQAGDRVVLHLGNRPQFLALVLACARIGVVSVPIGTRLAADEVTHVIQNCGAVVLFHESEFLAAVPPASATPTLRLRVALEGPDGGPDFSPFLDGPAPKPAPAAEEEVAVLLYTSGTTGKPKGAMLTNLGLVHSVMHFAICFDLAPSARTLLAVPCSHVTGLVSLLLTTVYVGGTTILMSAFKARDFLALAERERMTFTLMVPAMYLLCLRDDAFHNYRLDDWRLGGFGGSPMPEAAIAELAQKLPSLQLRNAYGATETTSPATLMPPGAALAHPNSVGQVVPCGEVRVMDEHGTEVPAGTSGELWIRGPMVVPGYWSNPQANASSFNGGFWKSGDVGSKDAKGFVKVFDRIKDMINRGGYKIFSAEVENVLAQHPDVIESAVIGEPCPVLYERVRAVVYATAPQADPEALREHCAQRLADYKVPEFIEIRTAPLPRNANGKLQKNQLRTAR